MNKWKIAFWCCLISFVLMTAIGLYAIVDQSVTLTYMREGYTDTKNDLDYLSKIINETDLTKTQIKKALTKHRLYEFMDFERDTISLDRVSLLFKSDKLFKVENQW